jgi:hypothetical protein
MRHPIASLSAFVLALTLFAAVAAAAPAKPAKAAPAAPEAKAVPAPAPASAEEAASRLVSIDAKNMPLRDILARVREQTGYTVVIDERHANTPLTLRLSRVDVEAAVRRLARKLSLDNYALVLDAPGKTITLRPVGAKKPEPVPAGNQPPLPDEGAVAKLPETDVDPLDVEILPPGPGQERGVTQRDIDAAREAAGQIDPLDVEVIPPMPGQERGITQRDIEAAREAASKVDPLDVEVIPPTPGQERGMTLREVEAARDASSQNIDPLDVEVLPPGPGQERGTTLRELQNPPQTP